MSHKTRRYTSDLSEKQWCRDGTWQRINRQVGYLERRRVDCLPHPSAGVMDSQSVKTQDYGALRGYDGNKKIKGRKRHLLVDTLGNLLAVVVSAANTSDTEGCYNHFRIHLEIVQPQADQVGFAVQPRRWVVERTLSWLIQCRRLAKDYEKYLLSSEGMIYRAAMRTMLRRLST